jgi:hypothetical protein
MKFREESTASKLSMPVVLPGPGLISILSEIVNPSGIKIISPSRNPSLILVVEVRKD